MKAFMRGGLCVAALSGGAALAQDDRPIVGTTGELTTVETVDKSKKADTGLYAQVGGGAEGYTGQLAPTVNPGLAYGVTAGYRPLGFLGVELGYNGGLSDVGLAGSGGISDGPDIVRNGGQAVVVGNLTDTKLQPYVLGGIGVEHYNVRNDRLGNALGYQDDTNGFIPAGVGLRYQLGDLITADARVNYNFLFDQNFAPTTTGTDAADGRYSAMLSLGGTY